ncbi:MAG: hypothetical protein KGH57_04630 [Candidatus Micrarchaeota archaeon]|nr:hypothetical protein [Candidatus Micrarchaeota archaeon]
MSFTAIIVPPIRLWLKGLISNLGNKLGNRLDLSSIFGRFGKKKSAANTVITAISIDYLGDKHGLDGMRLSDSVFELKIPFQNKTGSDLLDESLKRPDLRIDSVGVSKPFELLEVNPSLPISVKYTQGITLALKIKAPGLPYTGPLSVSLGEKASGMVRVQIEKMLASYKGQKFVLEEAPSVLSVQKGQVLKRDVQLYKVMKYGDSVNGIRVNAPFVFSGSEPKAPFRIDKENSYIISVFVLAPEYSYAGPLEIAFS